MIGRNFSFPVIYHPNPNKTRLHYRTQFSPNKTNGVLNLNPSHNTTSSLIKPTVYIILQFLRIKTSRNSKFRWPKAGMERVQMPPRWFICPEELEFFWGVEIGYCGMGLQVVARVIHLINFQGIRPMLRSISTIHLFTWIKNVLGVFYYIANLKKVVYGAIVCPENKYKNPFFGLKMFVNTDWTLPLIRNLCSKQRDSRWMNINIRFKAEPSLLRTVS